MKKTKDYESMDEIEEAYKYVTNFSRDLKNANSIKTMQKSKGILTKKWLSDNIDILSNDLDSIDVDKLSYDDLLAYESSRDKLRTLKGLYRMKYETGYYSQDDKSLSINPKKYTVTKER